MRGQSRVSPKGPWIPGLIGCSLLAFWACTGPTAANLETPEQRAVGTPIGRSDHPRSGHLSYRVGRIEQVDDLVLVDLHLYNGTKRDYATVTLRVLVHGGPGELASIRVPLGGMGADRSRPVSARLPGVPFQVRDVGLELIYAVP
jgi:hypothetical protein